MGKLDKASKSKAKAGQVIKSRKRKKSDSWTAWFWCQQFTDFHKYNLEDGTKFWNQIRCLKQQSYNAQRVQTDLDVLDNQRVEVPGMVHLISASLLQQQFQCPGHMFSPHRQHHRLVPHYVHWGGSQLNFHCKTAQDLGCIDSTCKFNCTNWRSDK